MAGTIGEVKPSTGKSLRGAPFQVDVKRLEALMRKRKSKGGVKSRLRDKARRGFKITYHY